MLRSWQYYCRCIISPISASAPWFLPKLACWLCLSVLMERSEEARGDLRQILAILCIPAGDGFSYPEFIHRFLPNNLRQVHLLHPGFHWPSSIVPGTPQLRWDRQRVGLNWRARRLGEMETKGGTDAGQGKDRLPSPLPLCCFCFYC